jgi:uncharacterized protein
MKKETRFFALNVRSDDSKQFTLEGLAASFDTLSEDLGGFRERISPSAFDRSLKDNDDVVALLNHSQNHVLARVKSGTLNIFKVAKGLGFRAQLDPDNSTHRDVYAMCKRGDIHQCSFAFTVPEGGDDWDEAVDDRGQKFVRRTLKNVNLHDVSVVTRPAYAADGATSVDARATSDAAVDAFNRHRCNEIGREIEADFQKRISAAGEAVRAGALKDLGIKLKGDR